MTPTFHEIEIRGGFLVCQECGHKEPLGDPIIRERDGWPICCGQTMLWKLAPADLAVNQGAA